MTAPLLRQNASRNSAGWTRILDLRTVSAGGVVRQVRDGTKVC